MIAKNEEDHIRACLDSVKDYVDEIIVVLDSRSSDKTEEIARSFGAHVFSFDWVDSFSIARNESLKHATKDWVFCLDADEVVNERDMKKLHMLLDSTDKEGFLITQRNYTEDKTLRGWQLNDAYNECKASGYHSTPIVRVFRNHKGYEFVNRVHEEVDTSILKQGRIGDSGIPVHHYGLLKGNLEEKRDLYLDYGLKQIKDEPENIRSKYEVARIYKARGKYNEAIQLLAEVLKVKPSYRHTLVNIADCYHKIGALEKAIKSYKLAIKVRPKDEVAYLNFGVLLVGLDKLGEASSMFNFALAVNPKSPAAHQNLIGSYVKAKRPGDAFAASLRAYETTRVPKFKDTADLLRKQLGKEADIYEALGRKDYRHAERLIEEQLEKQPYWHGHYINLSNVYLKENRKEDAQKILLKGIQRMEDAKAKGILQTTLNKLTQ